MFARNLTLPLLASALWAQPQPRQTQPQPLYRVTVVQRSTKAINYRYRSEPTMIDFAGTVLMPKAKGNAVVTSKQGRTEIEANFDRLTSPAPFGHEYLTYVLWALTPDGRPHNLGEVITNSRDHAALRVSTDLQAFALIVTAEPYSSVRSPGDVVVLENQVRPDTLGMIEEVNARYELLPRGQYTLNLSDSRPPDSARVSTREYEVLLELYQAQNAINIARTAHADRLAPEVFSKAEALLNEARTRHEHKGDRTTILQQARQATQTAEDARLIAVERSQRESVIALKAEALANRQAQANAEAEAARARVERQALEEQLHRTQAELQAARANAQAEAERAARLPTEADRVGQQPPPPQQQQQQPPPPKARQADQRAYRLRVFESLNAVMPALDTPRGLVVVISDGMFKGSRLQPEVVDRARRLAAALASYQGLRIIVEGHSASAATEREAAARAGHVAELLRSRGLQASARSMGNRRPAGPGRVENNRIEIVVWGEAIGTVASWDRPYSLSLR